MSKIKKEEEIHKGLRLLDIVSKENIYSEDETKVIYEGELLKFLPNVKQQYYAKWAQITKREFKYFKDRLSAGEWLAQPLISISLLDIEKVERVSVKLDSKGIVKTKDSRGPYQFEIILRPNSPTKSHISSRSRSAKKANEFPESNKNSIRNKSPAASIYNASQIRKMDLGAMDKKSYMDYVKNKADELKKVGKKEELKKQINITKAKGISGIETLTSREKIRKNIQERHIYACNEKMESERWVFVLNWVIELIREAQNEE